LLKSSDFVLHDLDAESVFDGCVDNAKDGNDDAEGEVEVGGGSGRACAYRLELVLRKWFAIEPSREMRAFVRDGVLVGAFSVFSVFSVSSSSLSLTYTRILFSLAHAQRNAPRIFIFSPSRSAAGKQASRSAI
jgi:hypothetical protein